MSTLVIDDATTIRASYATADAIEGGDRIYAFGQFVGVDHKHQIGQTVLIALETGNVMRVAENTVLSYI